MTIIERYKEAKRTYEKCQEEYSLCLNYAVIAMRNRDDAELKMRLARVALAEQRGFTTEKEVDDFVADPLGIDRYVMGIRNSSVEAQEEKKNG